MVNEAIEQTTHFDWTIFWSVLPVVVTAACAVIGYQWKNHRQNRKTNDRLLWQLSEFSLHDHAEKDGPLSVAGLRRPRIPIGGSNGPFR